MGFEKIFNPASTSREMQLTKALCSTNHALGLFGFGIFPFVAIELFQLITKEQQNE